MTQAIAKADYSNCIVGIDLGTTNSLIAVYRDNKITILEIEGDKLLPSYVGLSPSDDLLVGHPARNQYILYPERTIKSIKRKMGGTESVVLGDRSLLPEEVSALILGHLKRQAEIQLGIPVRRAVITVPAYFNDVQRQATRSAGEIAGLEVVRIINEPTAASLAFRNSVLSQKECNGISAVYDLGGGTFDVSIVREEGDVTEVLASHGDTRLGGDDFDRMILDHFMAHIRQEYQTDLHDDRRAVNRLTHAAEQAKIELSAHPFVHVVEEDLAVVNGRAIHLDLELSRSQYEDMIRSYVDRTVHCIQQALLDANLTPSQIDHVLLAGGSTRTPLVRDVLQDFFQREPRSEVHPDLCVAMGAALLGARIQGLAIEQILVDITPQSFGMAALGIGEDGLPNLFHFVRIIPRNTPLPVTRSESFYTLRDNQEAVDVEIYQGENDDVRYNTKIGNFLIEGLSKVPAGNTVIGRMSLDLNGILTVTAVEKSTGLQKSIKIEGVHRPKTALEIEDARSRLADLIPDSQIDDSVMPIYPTDAMEQSDGFGLLREQADILNRARSAFEKMHPDDRQEAEDLCQRIEQLASEGKEYDKALNELQELLYFVGA
ncbi:MAG: heat-shock protein Hsp70 [Candidatus Omnitrophota bacterium]|jgi:molecular chaperone DnaK (HSP70)|nr:MAG: heat-shock protein Hsp70 [Candidatus Omnitrophota bacterium]